MKIQRYQEEVFKFISLNDCFNNVMKQYAVRMTNRLNY